MISCTLFSSSAQILLKFASNEINLSSISSFFNSYLIFGCICLGIGAILMFMAFKIGELSVLFPILATSYVWVSLISPIFFPEDNMNLWKWVGVGIILLSVSLLGYASSRETEVILDD